MFKEIAVRPLFLMGTLCLVTTALLFSNLISALPDKTIREAIVGSAPDFFILGLSCYSLEMVCFVIAEPLTKLFNFVAPKHPTTKENSYDGLRFGGLLFALYIYMSSAVDFWQPIHTQYAAGGEASSAEEVSAKSNGSVDE